MIIKSWGNKIYKRENKQLMNNSIKFLTTTLAFIIASITITSAQWSIVGNAGITNAVANYTDMAVDNNDVPYIAFADNANGDKLSVKKWTGSSWQNVATGISSGSVQRVSMTVDRNNNDIYIAYKDWGVSGKLCVKKYNGSSWSTLGNGITSGSVDYVSAVVYSGMIIVAYKDNNQGGKATCAYYYNGNWYALGSVGFTSTSVSYVNLMISPSGYAYIAARDNNNRPVLYDWTSNGWSYAGAASSNGGSDLAAAIDNNNNVYITYRDWSSSSKLVCYKYNGSSFSQVGTKGFTPNGAGAVDIAIDLATNTPYIAYRDDANNQKASVMSFSGSSWSNVGSAGFSNNTVDYTSIAITSTGGLYVGFKDNAVGQKATVMSFSGSSSSFNGVTWDGSTSDDWSTGSNWSGNSVPTSGDNVLIPSGLSRYPNVTSSGYIYCNDLVVGSGASLTINNWSAYLKVYGDILDSGTVYAPAGGIAMLGSSAQTITATNNIDLAVFYLYNNSGCTINDTMFITNVCAPMSGTLTTNDKLVLKSNASGTARIQGNSNGNYINGKVTVERYIPGGRRAFRFLSHPFSTSIPLSQLTDDIDITGQGGTTNGFTAVQVNAPSAFWFDVTTADTSTTGNNPGWKDFTSANTSSWDPYEMARILIRGTKGQGLTQGSYTPGAVTLDMTGTVNQGNKTVTINKGSNSKFIICGNPYPSQVNLKNVSRSNVGANFCVWDPNQGTWGGYTSHQFSSNYYLPMGSAFVTEVTSGNSGTFYFEESDKDDNTPASLFKTTADPLDIKQERHVVEISIEDNDLFWDRILIEFDSSAKHTQDSKDMLKFYNPDLDVYTLMDDSTRISIDARPFEDGKVIPMGIVAYETMELAIRVPQFNVPEGAKLYLHDKYLNKVQEITEGFEYWFDITKDPASMGNNRFTINMGYEAASITIKESKEAHVRIAPNPATTTVNVSFEDVADNATLRITDMSGKAVYQQAVNANMGKVSVPVNQLPTGIYMVELNSNGKRVVEKLIKQ